eukprot:g11450.t1
MAGEEGGSAAVAPPPTFKKRAAGGKNFRRRGKGGGGGGEKPAGDASAGSKETGKEDDGRDKNRSGADGKDNGVSAAGATSSEEVIVDHQRSAGGQGDVEDGDEEDGSRLELLADLREEQRARRKGGGRSVSALMGGRGQKKGKDALVIKGQGVDGVGAAAEPAADSFGLKPEVKAPNISTMIESAFKSGGTGGWGAAADTAGSVPHEQLMEQYVKDKMRGEEDGKGGGDGEGGVSGGAGAGNMLSEEDRLYTIPEDFKKKVEEAKQEFDTGANKGDEMDGEVGSGAQIAWNTGLAEIALPIEFKLKNMEDTLAARDKMESVRAARRNAPGASSSLEGSLTANYSHHQKEWALQIRALQNRQAMAEESQMKAQQKSGPGMAVSTQLAGGNSTADGGGRGGSGRGDAATTSPTVPVDDQRNHHHQQPDLGCSLAGLSKHDRGIMELKGMDVFIDADCAEADAWTKTPRCNMLDIGQNCRGCFSSCDGALAYFAGFQHSDHFFHIRQDIAFCPGSGIASIDTCTRTADHRRLAPTALSYDLDFSYDYETEAPGASPTTTPPSDTPAPAVSYTFSYEIETPSPTSSAFGPMPTAMPDTPSPLSYTFSYSTEAPHGASSPTAMPLSDASYTFSYETATPAPTASYGPMPTTMPDTPWPSSYTFSDETEAPAGASPTTMPLSGTSSTFSDEPAPTPAPFSYNFSDEMTEAPDTSHTFSDDEIDTPSPTLADEVPTTTTPRPASSPVEHTASPTVDDGLWPDSADDDVDPFTPAPSDGKGGKNTRRPGTAPVGPMPHVETPAPVREGSATPGSPIATSAPELAPSGTGSPEMVAAPTDSMTATPSPTYYSLDSFDSLDGSFSFSFVSTDTDEPSPAATFAPSRGHSYYYYYDDDDEVTPSTGTPSASSEEVDSVVDTEEPTAAYSEEPTPVYTANPPTPADPTGAPSMDVPGLSDTYCDSLLSEDQKTYLEDNDKGIFYDEGCSGLLCNFFGLDGDCRGCYMDCAGCEDDDPESPMCPSEFPMIYGEARTCIAACGIDGRRFRRRLRGRE